MARLYEKLAKDRQGRTYSQGWYADFQVKGSRVRISLHTKDEATARARLVEHERKQALGLWDPRTDPVEQPGVTVSEAVKRYLKHKSETCTASTVSGYRYILERFAGTLPPGLPIRAVSVEHVTAFLNLPKRRQSETALVESRSDATRHDYSSWIRSFFEWCKKAGFVLHNPVVAPAKRGKARHVGKREGPPPFFTPEQFDQLCRAIEADAILKHLSDGNRWLLDFIRFAVGTGLRRAEIIFLRWDAIDLEAQMIRVRNTEEFSTKSGRERSVPVVGEALAIVTRLHSQRPPDPAQPGGGYVFRSINGSRLSLDYLTKRFRQYRQLAKLPDELHLHSLRHTFASWFVLRKGDIYFLKKIMGHESLKTTMKYAHLRPDALRSEMESAFGAGLYSATNGTQKGTTKGTYTRRRNRVAVQKGF